MSQAKLLLAEDQKYQKWFKFDHICHFLKDCENLPLQTQHQMFIIRLQLMMTLLQIICF